MWYEEVLIMCVSKITYLYTTHRLTCGALKYLSEFADMTYRLILLDSCIVLHNKIVFIFAYIPYAT